MALTDAQILAELEDLLRTMPARDTMHHPTEENYAWFGRARAIMAAWYGGIHLVFGMHVDTVFGNVDAMELDAALSKLQTILHQARWDLRMRTTGPLSVAVNRGQPFDYFDEVRKLIAAAQTDILFVDPYLDADFVARYLPHVRAGVTIRLLTSKNLSVLLPSVHQFALQHGASVEVRKPTARPHDRYVFVDRAQCYLSSASFQDGGRVSPATLQQISDSFAELSVIYESEWANGSLQRAP
jgi:hypothetical protein